jgi:alpha-glucosidase (family GH31 glycosyl hydrolase)
VATLFKSPKRTAKKPSNQVPVFAKKAKAGPLKKQPKKQKKDRSGKRSILDYECPEGYEMVFDDRKPSAKTKKRKSAEPEQTTKRVSSKSKKRQKSQTSGQATKRN